MSNQLNKSVSNALLWSSLERISLRAVKFVISIVLARLLLPSDYGLIGILVVFMAISQTFVDSGFGSALIQKKDASLLDECSVFYFNLLASTLVAILLCLSAPLIADFYNQPILTPLSRVLSLNLILNAFGLVHLNLLTKNVDFKSQFKATLPGTLISGVIGIAMAYQGFGVWSLVAQSISSNAIRSLMLWLLLKWRPAFIFSFTSIKTLFSFGSRLLFTEIVDTVFRNIYILVIGKLFQPVDLGYYTRAQSLKDLPVTQFSMIFRRVSFPVFCSIQNDKKQLKESAKKFLKLACFVNFPIMGLILMVSDPLVPVLLTEKWRPTIPFLQLLCVVGILYPLHSINLNLLNAQGRSDLYMRIEILKKLFTLIILSITWQWGITAMIYGQILQSFIAYALNTYYTGKLVNYRLLEQLHDLLPYLTITLGMCSMVGLMKFVHIGNDLSMLMLQTLTGGIAFLLMCIMFKPFAYVRCLEEVKPIFKRAFGN